MNLSLLLLVIQIFHLIDFNDGSRRPYRRKIIPSAGHRRTRPPSSAVTRRPIIRRTRRPRPTNTHTTPRSWNYADKIFSKPYTPDSYNPFKDIEELQNLIESFTKQQESIRTFNDPFHQFASVKKDDDKVNSSNNRTRSRRIKTKPKTAIKTDNSTTELIVFSQLWPRAINKQQSVDCRWVVSGLRLSNTSKGDLENCTDLAVKKSIEWNDSAMDDISDDLILYWYDAMTDGYFINITLWKNAWERYGTCGLDIDNINTIEKYFNKVMDLYEKYDIKEMLEDNTVKPQNKYPLETIQNAISNSFGSRGYVSCNVDDMTSEQELNEIYLCFNKSFELTDCDGLYKSELLSNCNKNTDVTFP